MTTIYLLVYISGHNYIDINNLLGINNIDIKMIHQLTSGELHTMIEEQVINPDITNEIKSLLSSRNKWRTVSNISETSGQVFIVASTMLAFASGVYKCNDSLSFAAGCVNVASISLLKFSSYAANESAERNKLLNKLLERCNVTPMPRPMFVTQEINNIATPTNTIEVI